MPANGRGGVSGSLRERLAGEGIDETRYRRIMAALGVPGPALERPVETMSYGQQKKVDLARSLLKPADFLIRDEPLNFIDIGARERIEDAVLRDAPTLVFVEHDAAFVDRVATRRVELVPTHSSARSLGMTAGQEEHHVFGGSISRWLSTRAPGPESVGGGVVVHRSPLARPSLPSHSFALRCSRSANGLSVCTPGWSSRESLLKCMEI